MSEKTISIGFTNEEHSKLLKLAQNEGMSIAQYIKSMIIPNELNEQYNNLIQKIIKLKPDTVFSIKDLWEYDEWNKISRGVKLSLGKHFYKNVEAKKIHDVKKKGFGVAGIMCYKKE
jgi:predicted DNA-binding protein